MKEKGNTSTSNRKKILYSLILTICVLLLVTATVLTVYFVTTGGNEIVDNPPVDEPPVDDPPVDNPPDDGPSGPSGGGGRVVFVSPVADAVCSVEYKAVYNNRSLDQWYYHRAMDFEAAEGTTVCAMGDGKVVSISLSAELGNLIVIEHEDGIRTLYRFVEPVSSLREGDYVHQGEKIATVASAYGTEYKDGTHLHLEMTLNGDFVDPTDYIDVTFEEK